MILDKMKMTPHQKVAHMPLLETIQSPDRSCRTAELVDRIAGPFHSLRRSPNHSLYLIMWNRDSRRLTQHAKSALIVHCYFAISCTTTYPK